LTLIIPLLVSLIAVACAGFNLASAIALRARARKLRAIYAECEALTTQLKAAVEQTRAIAADPPLEYAPHDAIVRQFWDRHCCGVAIVHRHGTTEHEMHLVKMTPPEASTHLIRGLRTLAGLSIEDIQKAQDQTDRSRGSTPSNPTNPTNPTNPVTPATPPPKPPAGGDGGQEPAP